MFYINICYAMMANILIIIDQRYNQASTHPGAGVPIVLTSAKITVDEMIKDIERGV
ncbi:TPA: hypothetical protein PP434_000712 [Staphylococcus aureus]|nr:hypothetical protein [Staphylococcus aureus]HDJ3208005.1 hypothetical protein [Staphylococcus aureus]